MRGLRNILILSLLLMVTYACGKDELKDVTDLGTPPEELPTMVTNDVLTLISDSGITQYRITSPVWKIFEQAKQPYWIFPEGLKLEQFDVKFNVCASIRCDSARYFKEQQLWKLDGNVQILNERKEKILTNQLFWNQRAQKVYSDSFIHIESPERVIEGYGFQSNERITTYNIYRVMAIFPVDEKRVSTRQ
jgi:Protein of unknown function (DUF1239).